MVPNTPGDWVSMGKRQGGCMRGCLVSGIQRPASSSAEKSDALCRSWGRTPAAAPPNNTGKRRAPSLLFQQQDQEESLRAIPKEPGAARVSDLCLKQPNRLEWVLQIEKRHAHDERANGCISPAPVPLESYPELIYPYRDVHADMPISETVEGGDVGKWRFPQCWDTLITAKHWCLCTRGRHREKRSQFAKLRHTQALFNAKRSRQAGQPTAHPGHSPPSREFGLQGSPRCWKGSNPNRDASISSKRAAKHG